MHSERRVAAVTVAYENPPELARALSSLSINAPVCSFVVDNSEDVEVRDENARIVAEMGAVHLPQVRNLGSAGGFAVGMERAYREGFDWVWLFDQDGEAECGCLEKLLEVDDEIICPVVWAMDGGYLLPDFRCRIGFLGAVVPLRNFPSQGVERHAPVAIDLAGTHGILIHRDVIERIGYYDDKRYFVGGEDFDYCLRARRAGVRILLVSDASVYHPDLSKKSRFSRRACALRRLSQKFSPFLPQFLGFLRRKVPERENLRRATMIRFHRERLKTPYFLLALFYSVPALCALRLAGFAPDIAATLRLYFTSSGNRWEGSNE